MLDDEIVMTEDARTGAGAQKGLSPYVPQLARVIKTRRISPAEKLFQIEMEDGHPLNHRPGQFVAVSVPGIGEAPVSICTSPTEGPGFGLCIRKIGSLTTHLHGLEEGDWIGVRGPFGRGFPMEAAKDMDLLFVAGGIGLAPLRSAIRYAMDRREHYRRITLLYGARTPDELLFAEEIQAWSNRDDIAVLTTVDSPDSGWKGHVGVITTLFPRLKKVDADRTVAMVVGPPVMYRFVFLELMNKDIPPKQVVFSLERRMKCGIGKCGHCQINGTYVCLEGPAFSYTRLEQLWEAVERVSPVR